MQYVEQRGPARLRQVNRLLWSCCCFVFSLSCLHSQLGGIHSFEYLELPVSARSTSLGGAPVALLDDDINLGYSNPAIINDSMSHHLAINYNFHFADINYGFAAYGFDVSRLKTSFMVGVNFVSYGDFVRADEFGNQNGNFNGREMALNFAAGRQMNDRVRLGLNIKLLNSTLESFTARGIAADIGLYYNKPESLTNIGIVVRNLGFQTQSFEFSKESLPLDVHIGISNKLQYLPFTFMLTATNLGRWNLRAKSEFNRDPIFINQQPTDASRFSVGIDNLFRHLIFGGELLLGRNGVFVIRAGYNHNRKQELAVSGFRSFSGLSYGFGFKIKKIKFDYGVGTYHLAGSVNHISMVIDLNQLVSRF